MSADQGKVYIFPSILNSTLTKAGYSPRKTLKYLGDIGAITASAKANGGKEYCVRKWFDNRTCRFVEFDLKRFSKPTDPLDEEEAAAERDGTAQAEDGFIQMEIGQESPFDTSEPKLPY
mgnify:FL=1